MGIMNFMGERAKVAKSLDVSIKVSDYMAKKLITFVPQQSLMETMETLVRNDITGAVSYTHLTLPTILLV